MSFIMEPFDPTRVWKAPWTPTQVRLLQYRQAAPLHQYTCGNDGGHALVPTEAGWTCPVDSYTQDWAHAVQFPDCANPACGHQRSYHMDGTDCVDGDCLCDEYVWPPL